ncbi:LysR family transcriptional regulator [Actinomadura sp. NTSP31]|uniref:LysR family transcriptional regulator n=1 Tax=Actinomadura sp. NTSP31 TaxID=1735447 RepID=UPI0035C11D6E
MEQDFDLRLLRYFLAVAEAGTFTGASERLQITQPALSRAIRTLEKAVETPLFNRSPHGVELTQAGLLLSQDARTLVDLADTALTRLLRLGQEEPQLRVSAQSCDIDVLQQLVDSYNRCYPGARQASAKVVDRRVQLDQVRDGEVDVTLRSGPADLQGLEADPIRCDPRVAVLPESHPLAGRTKVHRSELDGETFPVWASHTAEETAFWTGTDRTPYEWQAGPVVHDLSQFVAGIRLGRGVGFLAARHVRDLPRTGLSVVPQIEELSPIELRVIWAARATSVDVAQFVRHAGEALCRPDMEPCPDDLRQMMETGASLAR